MLFIVKSAIGESWQVFSSLNL